MKKSAHTGYTSSGFIRDVKVERLRRVTIYRRGNTLFLYYRENGKSIRRPVDGNLAVARATASKIVAALEEGRPSPLGFCRVSPEELVNGFLEYVRDVQNLALRTQDRYRAALTVFTAFAAEIGLKSSEQVTPSTVEDFIKWLRGRKRARNGAKNGRKDGYKTGGIKFILCTVRTAFNWAAKRRYLPPYMENPLSSFPIDQMRDRDREAAAERMMHPNEQAAFFRECDDWQRPIFLLLTLYGLRVGELVHLLVEDVDFDARVVHIRSKPELYWRVKTGRERVLPLLPETRVLLEKAIGKRGGGFVFLNRKHGSCPTAIFTNARSFWSRAREATEPTKTAGGGERALRREATIFCRRVGLIPEKRVRDEFVRLTKKIGRPDLTRVHDLRHLFASRAQELGLNPLLVQELLGHSTLSMTRRYTHLGMDAKRDALQKAVGDLPLMGKTGGKQQ
jgi:integrase